MDDYDELLEWAAKFRVSLSYRNPRVKQQGINSIIVSSPYMTDYTSGNTIIKAMKRLYLSYMDHKDEILIRYKERTII